jgi:hypothetical protein
MPIPVDFNTVFARCKRVMLNKGHALIAITNAAKPAPIIWESELRPGGKVKVVPDLEKLARDLGVMEDFEVSGSDWAACIEASKR